VDRVLPEAPYRQWVLTFPWQVRFLLGVDKAFLSEMLTAFLRTLFSWLRLQCRRLGVKGAEPGSVTFVQRFGGMLKSTCGTWRRAWRSASGPSPAARREAAALPASDPAPGQAPPATPGPSPTPRHLSWASLLKRVLDVDALTCPRCNVPMVVLAFLTDPPVVRRILDHLHLPSVPPLVAPARCPFDGQQGFFDDPGFATDPSPPTPGPALHAARSPP